MSVPNFVSTHVVDIEIFYRLSENVVLATIIGNIKE